MTIISRVLDVFRTRLSVKLSLRVAAVALPVLAIAAWLVVAGQRAAVEDMVLERGRVAAIAGAQAYASILESGVRSGEVTLADLVEPTYQEILFQGIQVADKRYHTRYDSYTDSHGIQQIQDAILASSTAFVYASGVDVRGYVPTPHQRYAEPPNGDAKHDRAVSRGKRKYDHPEVLAAAGYMGSGPTLVQDYHRDTGELIWDVAAPIYVQGKHFGAFRVGVLRSQVKAWSEELAISLARVLGAAVALMALAILLAARRSTQPLVDLAGVATRMSTSHDGTELRVPIQVTSRDEVGQVARALERLRKSMLVSWRST